MDASDSASPDCMNNGGDEFGDLLILTGNDSGARHRLQKYRPPLATIDESTCTPTGNIGNSVDEILSRNQGDLSVLHQEYMENKGSGNYKILMNKSLCNRPFPNNVETIYQKQNWNEFDNEDNAKKTNIIDETFDDQCKLSQSCDNECPNGDCADLCAECQQEDSSKVVELSPKPSLHDMRSNITSEERFTFDTDTDSCMTGVRTGSGMEKSSSPDRDENSETSDYSELDETQALKNRTFNRVPAVVLGVMSSISLSSTDSIREIIKKERTDYKTYKQQHQSLHKKLWSQRSPIPIYSSSHAFESTNDNIIEPEQVVCKIEQASEIEQTSKIEQTAKIEQTLPEKSATAPNVTNVTEDGNVDTEIKKALKNIETNEVQLQKYVRNVREKLTLPSTQIDKIESGTEESDKCRDDNNQKPTLAIERADGIKNKVDSKTRTMINQPAGDNIARLKSISKFQQLNDYKVKEERKILTYNKPETVTPEAKPQLGTILSTNQSVKQYLEEVKQSATSSRSYFERCLNLLKKKASDFAESNKQEASYKEQKQEIQEKPKVRNDVLLINQIRNRIDETYRQANYYSNVYANKMPMEIENTIKSIEDAIKNINENNSSDKKLTRKNKQDLSVLIDKLNFIASYHKKIKVTSRKKKSLVGINQSKNSNETYGDRSMNVNYRSIEPRLSRKQTNNYNEHKFTPKKASIIKLIDTQLSANACEKYNMQTILAPQKTRNRVTQHVSSRLYKSKQFKQLNSETVHRCNSLFCSDKCKMVVEDMGKLKLEKRRIPSEEMIFKFEIKRDEHSASGDTKTQEDTGPSIVDRALIDQIREDYLRIQKRPRRIVRKKSSTSTITATSTIDIDPKASMTDRKLLDNEALSNITRETIAPLVAEYPKHVYTKKVLPEPETGRYKKNRSPTPTRKPHQALKTIHKQTKPLPKKTNESSIISVVQDAQEETVNQDRPPIDEAVKYNTADEETVSTDLETSSPTQETALLSETVNKQANSSVVSVTKLRELLEDPTAKFNPQYTVMPIYKTVLFAKKDLPEKPFESVRSPVRSYIHGLPKTKSRVDSSTGEKNNNRLPTAKKNFTKNQNDDRVSNKSTKLSETNFLSDKLGHMHPEKIKIQNTIKNVLIKNDKMATEDIGEIIPNAEHPKLLDSNQTGSVENKPKQFTNKTLSQKCTVYLENYNKNFSGNNNRQVKPKPVVPAPKRSLTTTEPNTKGKFTNISNIKHGHRSNVYSIIDDILTLTKPISQQKPKSRQNEDSGDDIKNIKGKISSHAELNKRMKNIKTKLEMDKIKFVKSLMKILSDETISDNEMQSVPKLGNAGEMYCPLQRKNSTVCMIEKASDASISLRNSRQINMAVTDLINIVDQVTDEVAKLTIKRDDNFAKSKSSSNLSSDHLAKLKSVSVSGSERSFTEKPQTPKTRRMHSADIAKTSKSTNKGSNSLGAITKHRKSTPIDKEGECASNEAFPEKLKDAEYFLGQIKSSTESLLRTLFEKRSAMVRRVESSFMCTSSDTVTELSDDAADYKTGESHKSLGLDMSDKSSLVSIYNSHDASNACASDVHINDSNKTPSNQNDCTEKRVTPVVKESKSQSINKDQYKEVISTTKSLLKIINDEIKVLQEKNESLSEHEQLNETRIFLNEIKSKTETLFLTIKGEKNKSRENTNQDTTKSKTPIKARSVDSEAVTCARDIIDEILFNIDDTKTLNIDYVDISNIVDAKISNNDKKISNIDDTKYSNISNIGDKKISDSDDAKNLNVDDTKKANIDDKMESQHTLHRTPTDLLFETLEDALQPETQSQTDLDKAEPVCKSRLSQNSDKKLKELFSPRSLKSSNMVLESTTFLSSSTLQHNQGDVMSYEKFTNSQMSHSSISTTAVCDFSASETEFEKPNESENKIQDCEHTNNGEPEPVVSEVEANGTKDRWLDYQKMDETLDDIENKVSIKDLISFIDRTAAEQEEYFCQPDKEPKTQKTDAKKYLTTFLSTDEDYQKKIAHKKQNLNVDENLKVIKTEKALQNVKDLASVDKNCQQKITHDKTDKNIKVEETLQNYKVSSICKVSIDEKQSIKTNENLKDIISEKLDLSACKVPIDKNGQKKTSSEKHNDKIEKNIKKTMKTQKSLQNDKDAPVCKKVPIQEKCKKTIVFQKQNIKSDENIKVITTVEASQNVENLSVCKESVDENYQKKIELEKQNLKANKNLNVTKTDELQHAEDLLVYKLSTDKETEKKVEIEKQNIIQTNENLKTIKTEELQHVKDTSVCKVSTDRKCQKKVELEKQNIKADEENNEKETEKRNMETNENLKAIKPEEVQHVQDLSVCKVSTNKICQKKVELEKQNIETNEDLKSIKTEELQHVQDSSVCKVSTNKICQKKVELEKQNIETNEDLKSIKTEELQYVKDSSVCKVFTNKICQKKVELEKQNFEKNENPQVIKIEELQHANRKCQKKIELEKQNIKIDQNVCIEENGEKKTEKQNMETNENLKDTKTEELQKVVCKESTDENCQQNIAHEKQNLKINEYLKNTKTEELQKVVYKASTDENCEQNIVHEKQNLKINENLKDTKTEVLQTVACKASTDENCQQNIVQEKQNLKINEYLKDTKTEVLQTVACKASTDENCQQKIVHEKQNIKTDENLKASKTEDLQKVACKTSTDEKCQQQIVHKTQSFKTDENLKAPITETLQKVVCKASIDGNCQQNIVHEKQNIKTDDDLMCLKTEEKSILQKQKNTDEKSKEITKIYHNLNTVDYKNTSQITEVANSLKCSMSKCVRCGKARENCASRSNTNKTIQRTSSSCSLPNYDTSNISTDDSKTVQATAENQSNCFKKTKQCENIKTPQDLTDNNLTRDADSKNKQNASSDLPVFKILPAAFPKDCKITKPKCENETSENKKILDDNLENKDNFTSDLKNKNVTERRFDYTDRIVSEVSDFSDSDDNQSLSSFDLPWGSPGMKHSDKSNSKSNLKLQNEEEMFQKGNYYLLRKFILDEGTENESITNVSEITSDKSMSRASDHLKGNDSCEVPRCVRCGNNIKRKLACGLHPQNTPDGPSKPCTLCFKHYLLLHDNSNLPKESLQKLMKINRMKQICRDHRLPERGSKSESVSSKISAERNTLNGHEGDEKSFSVDESAEAIEEKVAVSTNEGLIDAPTCILESDNCILGNPSYKMVEEEQNESLINDNNNIVKMELTAITKLVNKYLSNIDDASTNNGKESSEGHNIDSTITDYAAATDTSNLDQNEDKDDSPITAQNIDAELVRCTSELLNETDLNTKTIVEYNQSSDTNIVEVIELETKALKELVEQYINRIESRKRCRSRKRCLFKKYSFTRKEYRPTKFSNNEHLISLIVSAAYISLFVIVFGCLSFHIHYCDY